MARPLKEEIEQELLALPRKERAEGVEEDVDAYWKEELVRLSQEIDSGKAGPITAGDVFEKARRRFPKP